MIHIVVISTIAIFTVCYFVSELLIPIVFSEDDIEELFLMLIGKLFQNNV